MCERCTVDDPTIVFRLLAHRGVKLQRFAELVGFSYPYIYSIMVGKRPVTDEFRRRCVAYFQMPEDVLFFDHRTYTRMLRGDIGMPLQAFQTDQQSP